MMEWVPPHYRELILDAAEETGVPAELLAAQIEAESGWDPEAVSPDGAVGLAQFMPETWEEIAGPDEDPRDPEAAIPAQAIYMAELYDRFGSWDQALAAYNWGMGNLERQGMEAMPDETKNYLARIAGTAQRHREEAEAVQPIQTAIADQYEEAATSPIPDEAPRRELPQPEPPTSVPPAEAAPALPVAVTPEVTEEQAEGEFQPPWKYQGGVLFVRQPDGQYAREQ